MAVEQDRGWRQLPDGALVSSAGTVFRRTPQRVNRRLGRELVDTGSPVVTDIWPDGSLNEDPDRPDTGPTPVDPDSGGGGGR